MTDTFIIIGSNIPWGERYQSSVPNPMKRKYSTEQEARNDISKAVSIIEKEIFQDTKKLANKIVSDFTYRIDTSILSKIIISKNRELETVKKWKVITYFPE